MSIPQPTTVGSTIARGGSAAKTMSQENPPGPFDVWSHSVDGMTDQVQAAAKDPKSFLAGDPAQQARVQAAAQNLSSSSTNQIANSMEAQASALSQSVDAVGEAEGTLATVGAAFSVAVGAEQMLSTALSAIPFPAFPALRIMDLAFGLPHAHSHPPNLIPPAPPVPLPSLGPVIPIPILSGAMSTLINGMPAARCGDLGLGIWCGGYFPMYEVFLGSSNVWIEGMRAGRMLVDITRHCLFTAPRPSDFPIGPMWGTTISGSMNVLIGGVPMPSLTAIALGRALRGAFKLVGKGARAFARLAAPLRRRLGQSLDDGFLKCKVLRAEPVNFLTGEVVVEQLDYELQGRIRIVWTRYYGSQSARKGACGYGWSSPADARLEVESDGGVLFHDGVGTKVLFPYLPSNGVVQELINGATLEAVDDTLRVRLKDDLTFVFIRSRLNASEMPVRRVEDRCGNSLSYVRDEHGLREIVESAGRRIEVKSEQGLVREMWLRHSEHEPADFLLRYEYSAAAELLAVYDALENARRFRYEHLRLVQQTDRNGLAFYYAYDSERQSARCHHAWGDGGLYDYQFDFDPAAGRVRVASSPGAVSTIQLNELKLPSWEIDALGGITKYEYDDRGRTISVTDQDGGRTGYEYDDRGNLLKLTRPDGSCAAMTFNADNKVVTITEPNGAQSVRKWDNRGLLLEQVSPSGYCWRYTYNAYGQQTEIENPRGARAELSYDKAGNLICYKDALGHSTHYTYNARGNLTSRLDALNRTTGYQYDANDRLTEIRLPFDASVHYSYDAEGFLIRYADANGAVTRFEYGGLGKVVRRIQPDGLSVQYHYNAIEQLIGVTNQRGESYQITRDALGRVIEEVDYWGQSWRYKHSLAGHARESIDPLGRKTTYATDPMGRVLRKSFPDPYKPQKVLEETFEYDANGYPIVMQSPNMRVERKFDAEGLLVEEKQGEHFTIRNRYDEAGNRVLRQTLFKRDEGSAGHQVSYIYDALDRAVEIVMDGKSHITLGYNAADQIVAEKLGSHIRRDNAYGEDGRLVRRHVRLGSKDIVDIAYVHDAAGNIIERREGRSDADTFAYDPMGRIIEPLDPSRALERLTADPAGNLVERRDERGDLKLTWDVNHQLIESSLGEVRAQYGYDALGRRHFKRTESHATYFGWDGDALACDITPQGWREYVYYPGTFEPLARMDAEADDSHKVLYFHNDLNGCPIRILDERGSVQWTASYSIWGEARPLHAGLTDNALRLQGQYFDSETGLHFNRHRYYEPRIGQFASPDPLGLEAGEDLFRFASNALSWIDPLGLSSDLRGQYLGRTPGKYSATGRKVFDRMRADGLIVGNGPLVRGNTNRLWVVAGDGVPYFIDHTVDMAHLIDAVSWWNNVGRFYGPKSKEVRAFMLNPDHYILEPQSINRSLGAQLRENYLPPIPRNRILPVIQCSG